MILDEKRLERAADALVNEQAARLDGFDVGLESLDEESVKDALEDARRCVTAYLRDVDDE